MIFNLIKMTFIITLMLVVASCRMVPPTTYDYDVSYNFSQLKTFAWITPKSEAVSNESKDNKQPKEKGESEQVSKSDIVTLQQKRQNLAVESVLTKKGFTLVDSASSADFLIRNHNVTDKKKDVSTFYSTWGYYPYYHSPYIWPHHIANSVEREYEIGTLLLDIVDAKTREVIWRGSVSQKLGFYKNQTPAQRNQRVLAGVDLMLKSFPPESVK